jgi:glycerophosphoryl diester phosphodiesterase
MSVYNFAHRGARSLAPENTLPAIEKAWNLETDGVEVDVGVSKDGELILHHDTLLKRTTNVAEIYPERQDHPFSTFTFAELEKLDAGSWFIDHDPFSQIRFGNVTFKELQAMQGTRIPRLTELLDFIRNKNWRVNLELKKMAEPMKRFPLAEATLSLIKKEGIDSEKIIISSFDHENIKIVRKLNPAIEINALIGENPLRGNDWGNFAFSVYNANAKYINKRQVEQAISHNCTINLYTVNEPEAMRRYMKWGVRSLITDFPQILKDLIR